MHTESSFNTVLTDLKKSIILLFAVFHESINETSCYWPPIIYRFYKYIETVAYLKNERDDYLSWNAIFNLK